MHILITALDDGIKHSYLAWQGDIGYTSTPLFRHFQRVLATKMEDRSRFSPSSGPVNPVEDFVLVDSLEQFGFDTETICQSLMGMPPFGGYDDRSAAQGKGFPTAVPQLSQVDPKGFLLVDHAYA